MKYYLVGGAVRDLLLNRVPREYDLTLDAEAMALIQANHFSRKVGKSHEICLLNDIEHSLLRGQDIYEDMLHRDLTINALALDENGRIFCHPQALEDLKNKIIRPCADSSFASDPVRVFRAARFCATLPEFKLAPETCSLMQTEQLAGSLETIVAEQICNETIKALDSEQPGNFLRAMCQGQVLNPWFSELVGADEIPAGPPKYHNSSVLEHIAQVMDSCAASISKYGAVKTENASFKELKTLAVWMALCHDLGKTTTAKNLLPRHLMHELRGVELAKNLGTRINLPSKFIKAGQLASKLHMKAGLYQQLKASTKVALLTELDYHNLLEPFTYLVEADSGLSLQELMFEDLHKILAVKLEPKDMNQGKVSGEKLRALRIAALKK